MADDKNPPLPDLESDLQMVAPDAASTAPDESAGPKSAADLEAVFDVPVHVSAVLGRTRMDVGDLRFSGIIHQPAFFDGSRATIIRIFWPHDTRPQQRLTSESVNCRS